MGSGLVVVATPILRNVAIWSAIFLVAIGIALSGCARYRPEPLPVTPDLTPPPRLTVSPDRLLQDKQRVLMRQLSQLQANIPVLAEMVEKARRAYPANTIGPLIYLNMENTLANTRLKATDVVQGRRSTVSKPLRASRRRGARQSLLLAPRPKKRAG